jgi:NADH-quinone oxidoreductase subunit L
MFELLFTTPLIGIPLLMFLLVLVQRIRHANYYSKGLTQVAGWAQVLLMGGALGCLALVLQQGAIDGVLFSWFKHAQTVYSFNVHLDLYGSCFLLLTTFISAVIGRFSLNYLAHEEGYYKFFLNFYLMQLALYTLIISDNFYFTLIAWELLGLASVFLISFYQRYKKTVANALFVLGIYKFCDLFLIFSLLRFHHEQHSFLISGHHHHVSLLFLGALVIASMGKSALFPFSKWVPRAMEGPTTSSAIFYGALSIHAGIMLLMKFRLLFAEHPGIQALIFVAGLITVGYASLKSRIQTDVKSTLAYATVVQVGFIYMEFALGWYPVVVFHTLSNALLKTYQFTRSPSNIHHFHHLEKLNAQTFRPNGVHFERLLPKAVRMWTYRLIYHNFGLTLLWQSLLTPGKLLLQHLNRAIEGLNQRTLAYQPLTFAVALLTVILLAFLERLHWLHDVYVAGFLLVLAILLAAVSLIHSTIHQYLSKIKASYFLVSASAVLFFGGRFHYDATFYFVANLISLLVLDIFIRTLSQRLDLADIRAYLGVGSRYKYINLMAILILLMLTFTPGFASFVIFDVVLEDMSQKSQLVMVLFLIANTLNIYSIFGFIFKVIFGESQTYLSEYPDFTRRERFKLGILIVPMVLAGLLPFMIFH